MDKFIFHGVIEKEVDRYKAICLELDIATEGRTLEDARRNLKEAVEGYLECAAKEGDIEIFVPRPVPEEVMQKYETLFRKALYAPPPTEIYEFGDVVYA
ncbi:MAG: hypothetical protein QME81_09160 [bacterium]|nr:hypothetical protein [bacterium]